MRRWVVLVVAVAVLVIAVAQLVDRTMGASLTSGIERVLCRPSPGAAFAVFGLLAVDVLFPVPSSLVMILSGAVFGVVAGALLAFFGSLAGNFLGFEISRRYGSGLAMRLFGTTELELVKMRGAVSRYGVLAILLSRPLPVVMETLSIAAGLGDMKRSDFLSASILGTLPLCFVYAYAGAFSLRGGSIVPALVAAVAVPSLAWILWRRRVGRVVDRPVAKL
jgi:uncharacterized membrane protein YdjX (TVP38/TMEM64 family)